jgi:hypothetical protein
MEYTAEGGHLRLHLWFVYSDDVNWTQHTRVVFTWKAYLINLSQLEVTMCGLKRLRLLKEILMLAVSKLYNWFNNHFETPKNAVSWDVTPSGPYNNRRFRGTYRPHHQGDKKQRALNNVCTLLRLPVTTNVVPSSNISVTQMMEAIRSSETSVLATATQRNIPEDGISHSDRL